MSATSDKNAASTLDIVVVDDNRDNADALAELLYLFGHHVRVAYRGQDALSLLAQKRADVMFLDVNLPDTDGYAIARSVRTRFGQAIRLVALTGFSGSEAQERAGAAGFDSFIAKPPALEAVENALK
jgi:CheY-like chemotaxis protein